LKLAEKTGIHRKVETVQMAKNKRLIHQFLERSAGSFPEKIALIQGNKRVSYRELNSGANNLARFLIELGITKGDRIAILFENCVEFVISYYGVLKVGAVASLLRNDVKPESLAPLLENLQPSVIISSKRFSRLLRSIDPLLIRRSKLLIQNLKTSDGYDAFCWEEHVGNVEEDNPQIEMSDASLANIIFTSGSTGSPKGVMLTHANIVSNTKSICQYLPLSDREKHMVVLPFSYVMGLSILNTHFAVGGSLVINNNFAYPAAVLKQMVREDVTGFSGVPSTYAYLLHRSPLKSHRHQLTSLHYCTQAGGHMSAQIKKELRRALPEHTDIYIMYGATEASARLSYLEPSHYMKKMGSIGKAIPDVTLKILDNNGQEVARGQVGELVASGPNIMQGYWNDPESTKQVLDQHGYHTGDIAFQDDDGFFYLKGRKDNLLKVGGHRINPREIEEAILETDLAIEVAVFGVPDALLGNKLIALMAAKHEDIDENTVYLACLERLPKHKLPSEIKLVKSLPKNSSGKIAYAKFNEVYNEH